MRHAHHLPPNLSMPPRAPSVEAMGVLLPPQPLQRTCDELGICQGDGRCHGCDPVEPADTGASKWAQLAHAALVAALAGLSVGIALGALRWAADWVGA